VEVMVKAPNAPAATGGLAIEVNGLAIRFRSKRGGEVLALQSTTFDVRVGEILCIVGPSGCGKSTALNAVAGLLAGDQNTDLDVDGEIRIFGEPMRRQDPRVGYVFQQDTLLPWRTAQQNVALPLSFQGRADRDQAAMELLRRAGLGRFAERYPKELSGGMRKRIQLLQALAHDPQIILMDESFGALDTQTKTIMQNEFLRVWDRDRKTIVFVTHDLNEAILLGDRVICMTARPGKIKLEVPIDIPRPRTSESIIEHSAYSRLYSTLWSAVREEANRAMQGSGDEAEAGL
jgi:NitT/TauT family transport system ATP-binding protein